MLKFLFNLSLKKNTPMYKQFSAKADINKIGIYRPEIHHNLDYITLRFHETNNNEGKLLNTKYGEVFSVNTGKFTGRSPKDKWIVKNKDSDSENNIWWGDVNQPTTPDVFRDVYNRAINHFNTLNKCYIFDGFSGTNPSTRKSVRFIHELAWQQHFVKNMFITPEKDELENFTPDFTIINACSEKNNDWKEHGLNSDVAIIFNIEKKTAVILGTWYGGENKKGMFSLMNYWLPLQNIMSMHCSANIGKDNDTALFFGLSGTGKTTLSADPDRQLIGDDEHGWDNDGVFNLEGGCYAKTIDLSEKNEPEIYKAIKPNALLENVFVNDDSTPDYFNTSKTENGRVSYPIYHIDNYCKEKISNHPSNIIFLTCDAFGILPPVSILTPEQAMYHFLSGYTAKIAGTERGVTEPQATFSACFGAAFLTLHPTKYAELLQKKMETHNCDAYLVNTGWIGGEYGVGERISIQKTRSCINAILNGSVKNAPTKKHDVFNVEFPIYLPGVEHEICNPRAAWKNKDEYDNKAIELALMFQDNYVQYTGENIRDYSNYGPVIPSKI